MGVLTVRRNLCQSNQLKWLTKPSTALDIPIIFSLGKMLRDKENQHSYITTFSADRCGGLSDLVDVTVQQHNMAPFDLIT